MLQFFCKKKKNTANEVDEFCEMIQGTAAAPHSDSHCYLIDLCCSKQTLTCHVSIEDVIQLLQYVLLSSARRPSPHVMLAPVPLLNLM